MAGKAKAGSGGKVAEAQFRRHLPIIDGDSQGFWEGCRKGELRLQRCRACGRFRYAPKRICPNCLSDDFEWRAVSGRGKVYTFSVEHHAYHPAWKEDIPYAVAVVELEEGPRMTSRIIGCDAGEVRIGLPVRVAFEKVTEEITLPLFTPGE